MTIIAMGPESAGDRAVVISYHPDLLLVAIKFWTKKKRTEYRRRSIVSVKKIDFACYVRYVYY